MTDGTRPTLRAVARKRCRLGLGPRGSRRKAGSCELWSTAHSSPSRTPYGQHGRLQRNSRRVPVPTAVRPSPDRRLRCTEGLTPPRSPTSTPLRAKRPYGLELPEEVSVGSAADAARRSVLIARLFPFGRPIVDPAGGSGRRSRRISLVDQECVVLAAKRAPPASR